MSNLLALDIGSTTGFALDSDTHFVYGRRELVTQSALRQARKVRLDRRLDPRVPAMFEFVNQLIGEYAIDTVVFEDVQFIQYRKQGHLWPSLRAAIWLAAHQHHCLVDCLDVKKLKLYATGQGSATKERMISALKRWMPTLDFSRVDDNVADAVWLWRWGKEKIKI